MIVKNLTKNNVENDPSLNDLMNEIDNPIAVDDSNDLDMPHIDINMDKVNSDAESQAEYITERMSNYYFDQDWVDNHPYIKPKIAQEIQNIRRLLKMLTINEKAQDSIILSIAINASKATLYSALTALQNSTLNIQKQLDELISNLELTFKSMQTDCEKTFVEKDKEKDEKTGSMVVRGSREFIKEMIEKLNGSKKENTQQQSETNASVS